MQRRIQRRIEQAIDRTPENVSTLMQLDFVVRQLERVGDMATNIAEDVIFMVEGKIVRHEMLRRSLPGAAPRRIL
jgi:phosphate transport system protein